MKSWIAEHWHTVTWTMKEYGFILTSLIGSIIGMKATEGLSFKRTVVVLLTSGTTSILLTLTIDSYYHLDKVVLCTVSYFLGTVGNTLTIYFIYYVERLLKNPLQTLKQTREVINEIHQLRQNKFTNVKDISIQEQTEDNQG